MITNVVVVDAFSGAALESVDGLTAYLAALLFVLSVFLGMALWSRR